MRTQRGNILFLILLAIILFVALNYAIMGQREQMPNAIPKEKADAFAAQLAQNANLMENNMIRAMTIDSIKDYGFDFIGNSGLLGAGNANNTCTAAPCKIYADNGGGVPSLLIPDWASTAANTGGNRKAKFRAIQVVNVGTQADDLVLYYEFLQKDICTSINRLANATDMNINDTTESWSGAISFAGTYTSFPVSTGVLGDQVTSISGKRTFCFQHSSGYTFVHVLIAR